MITGLTVCHDRRHVHLYDYVCVMSRFDHGKVTASACGVNLAARGGTGMDGLVWPSPPHSNVGVLVAAYDLVGLDQFGHSGL